MSIKSTAPTRGRSFLTALMFLIVGSTLMLPRVGLAQTAPPPPPPPEESSEATPATPTTPPNGTQPTAPSTTPAPPAGGNGGGGRYLLLPDISFNGIFLGHLSTDKRDQTRDRLRLDQAEVGIQSYIYPGIKLDSFIVFDGGGGVNVEEAYLTYQNVSILKQQMSAIVGRRKVPFGRVNQLHPHSWLYAVQPAVLSNLVSSESLTGDGGYLSYLLPTGKLFSQLDVGYWSQSEPTDTITIPTDTTNVITSPGAGFADKFGTARLSLAKETLGGSMELGGSLAGGRSAGYSLTTESPTLQPDILLTGADITYRRAGSGTQRLLLRGEYVNHRQKDHDYKRTVDGYYVFADQRLDPFTSLGVRYDASGLPYADGKTRDVTLIGTKALTEATLYRLQFIHGDRPGKRNFNEVYFELVFGAGPHTHNLE